MMKVDKNIKIIITVLINKIVSHLTLYTYYL